MVPQLEIYTHTYIFSNVLVCFWKQQESRWRSFYHLWVQGSTPTVPYRMTHLVRGRLNKRLWHYSLPLEAPRCFQRLILVTIFCVMEPDGSFESSMHVINCFLYSGHPLWSLVTTEDRSAIDACGFEISWWLDFFKKYIFFREKGLFYCRNVRYKMSCLRSYTLELPFFDHKCSWSIGWSFSY